MGSVYTSNLATAAADRKLPAADLRRTIEAGPYLAEKAMQLRLIDRIGLDGRERADRDGDLHARSPRLSATARRIMSASPSVIGSRSTSSIFTQRTSAASLPAVIVSSDSGKAR